MVGTQDLWSIGLINKGLPKITYASIQLCAVQFSHMKHYSHIKYNVHMFCVCLYVCLCVCICSIVYQSRSSQKHLGRSKAWWYLVWEEWETVFFVVVLFWECFYVWNICPSGMVHLNWLRGKGAFSKVDFVHKKKTTFYLFRSSSTTWFISSHWLLTDKSNVLFVPWNFCNNELMAATKLLTEARQWLLW